MRTMLWVSLLSLAIVVVMIHPSMYRPVASFWIESLVSWLGLDVEVVQG